MPDGTTKASCNVVIIQRPWDVLRLATLLPLKKEPDMDLLDATADPDVLTQRADELLGAQRIGAARALLAAAQRLAPDGRPMASLAARIEMRAGNPSASIAALGQAIAVGPRAELFMLRADARRQLGDIAGAATDAAEAVIHDRNDPAAKALLGVLMLELGRYDDAVACLREAVGNVPGDPSFREGLANAQLASGDPVAAAATYEAGIIAAPGSLSLRNAAILLAVRERDFARAVALADAACTVGIADACTFGLKGHALSSLGQHDEAAEAYGDALKLGPEDPYVQHMVAAASMRPGTPGAPEDYVRSVFDGYADRFEAHLIGLGYRMPGVMRNAIRAHLSIAAVTNGDATGDNGATLGPVLDLGCGTGLVAVALADLPLGPFVGVDLSPRMLEHAAAKGLYAELHAGDVVTFLAGDTRQWRLMLAADVLVYIGALEGLLNAAYARLRPGALFIGSAEELIGPHVGNGDWALGRQGRYAHAVGYIERVSRAAGFVVRAIDPEVQRYDAGAPVRGFLIVLERPHGDS
jgi:predicted TPR repeat methyltransferase